MTSSTRLSLYRTQMSLFSLPQTAESPFYLTSPSCASRSGCRMHGRTGIRKWSCLLLLQGYNLASDCDKQETSGLIIGSTRRATCLTLHHTQSAAPACAYPPTRMSNRNRRRSLPELLRNQILPRKTNVCSIRRNLVLT